MVYGYVRVSTDKQTVENQKFEIETFARKEQCSVDVWIEETISGCKAVDERKLGVLLKQSQKGDILICAEISRLGRNLLMIMGILNQCMKKEIQVWTIKDNYRLGNDISSKVLAFAFSLSAEIERNLISQRTKEALARRKSEGKVLGRPKGRRSKTRKLSGKEQEISLLLDQNVSISSIARQLRVHRFTVSSFIKDFLEDRRRKKKLPPNDPEKQVLLSYRSQLLNDPKKLRWANIEISPPAYQHLTDLQRKPFAFSLSIEKRNNMKHLFARRNFNSNSKISHPPALE